MRRVLRPEGTLGVVAWASIEDNPASAALADVIDRHVDPELATWYRTAPFGCGSVQSLHVDLTEAGFVGVEIVKRELSVSFECVALFARVYIDGPQFADAGPTARQCLLDELEVKLSRYCQGGRLTYPTTAYQVRASRPTQ